MNKLLLFFIISLFTSLSQIQPQSSPISPKWVFEPWVWEDAANTDSATLALKNGYLNRHIPVGAVIIDSPWEGPNDSNGDREYNTFNFDFQRYKNPAELINDSLYAKGIHVILWITGNITTNCPEYQAAHDSSYFIKKVVDGNVDTTFFWRGNQKASHIDFFNPDAVAYWESLMDRVLDNYEVDGWKVDQSDYYVKDQILTYGGIKTKKQYTDAYYSEMYNYIHSAAKRGNQGIIMARPYCQDSGHPGRWFAPIQANTAGWVGDQAHTWNGLRGALNLMFISADAGYATVGSDIGGYEDKNYVPNKSLFIRWTELGSLLPVMENGGKTDSCHQPWLYDENTVQIYRYFAELHHELVPYQYSYDITAHLTGTPIVRPFGERSSSDTNSWSSDKRYLLGDNLFISAIYQDNTSRTITFPSGSSWINYWDEDDIHEGGTTATLNYSLEKYPIFIRSGAIIPLNADDTVTGHGSDYSKNYLTLLMYPDGLSSFKYYTDEFSFTEIKSDEVSNGFIISFSENTDSIIIRLKNKVEPMSIMLNGNINLNKKNSFSDFENSSSGWFYGKISEGENIYTWIKFSSPSDTVYVNNACSLDLHPDNYEFSSLADGNEYYVDRTFTLTTIPAEYQGFNMIKTANADKETQNLDFHFNLCSQADIYIAYDHRLTAPSWLSSNYVNTEKKINVTDTDMEYFNIWKRTTYPGIVTLGDNNGIQQSSMYIVFYKTYGAISADIKVFLEGTYKSSSHNMNTVISTLADFPKAQPYNVPPWNYGGDETVASIPSNVVDWVLVELRTGASSSTVAATRAAFLKSDGTIVDLEGTSPVGFSGITPGSYYIIVKHRNHLAVMSSDLVVLDGITSYDFTTGSDKYYGTTSGAKEVETNVWGMLAGDTNGDGGVGVEDYSEYKMTQGQEGYDKIADFNCDGGVGVEDYSLYKLNQGKESAVLPY